MISAEQAAELVELIESCQWERAAETVKALAAPRGFEASLVFAVCQRGQAVGHIFTVQNARNIEGEVEAAVLAHSRARSDPQDSFQAYRLVLHGEYETAKVARRK